MPYSNEQNLASLNTLLSQLQALLAELNVVPPVVPVAVPTIYLPPAGSNLTVNPFRLIPVTVNTTDNVPDHYVYLVHHDPAQSPNGDGDLARAPVFFFGSGSVSGIAFVPLYVLYQYGTPAYGYLEARASGNTHRIPVTFTY